MISQSRVHQFQFELIIKKIFRERTSAKEQNTAIGIPLNKSPFICICVFIIRKIELIQ